MTALLLLLPVYLVAKVYETSRNRRDAPSTSIFYYTMRETRIVTSTNQHRQFAFYLYTTTYRVFFLFPLIFILRIELCSMYRYIHSRRMAVLNQSPHAVLN